MSELLEATKLLAPGRAIFLVTMDEGGRPDTRAMAVAGNEGFKTVWMMTGKCSDKYKELSRNQNCLIYATEMEDTENYLEVRLWGRMELLDDTESKAKVWRDDYFRYFPEGKDDPNLCVMKFTTESGIVQTPTGKEKLAL